MKLKGVDVSHWQGSIDWKRAAKAGVRFAMIKALQGTEPDPRSKQNIAGAEEAGVSAGIYVYSTAADEAQARAEADAALDMCRGAKLCWPVALDFESGHFKSMKKSERARVITAFSERIEEGGRIPMLYSDHDWLTRLIPASVVKRYPIWLARWRKEEPEEPFCYVMWQSGTGRVPGIDGDVDLDWSYFDFAGLTGEKRLCAKQIISALSRVDF